MDVVRGMTGTGAGSPVALLEGRVSFRLQLFYWPLFVSLLFFFCCHSVSLVARTKVCCGNMLPSWTRAYLVVCRVDDTSKC